jgi:hypothetical protein
MFHYSSFLFARPSFLEGVARIVDFGNTLNQYNGCETPEQADLVAIASDWAAIGLDLDQAAAECIGPSWEARRVKKKAKKATNKLSRPPCPS